MSSRAIAPRWRLAAARPKVMALAIAWQYFNAVREQDDTAKDYAKTFLLIAPNVIVLERLKSGLR